jgi:hypothetical protein
MEAVQDYFGRLAQEIENVPTTFIFNEDESIFQEFMDAGEMRAMVPASYPRHSIEIPADRSVKRSKRCSRRSVRMART